MRYYTNAGALGDAMAAKTDEVRELITSVPGFIAYYAIRNGDVVTSVTVCKDKAGTDETTKRARAWVQENVKGGVSAPGINEGDTFISFTS
jgi:putative component of toxin-antitoxin plasmid stabilization module